MKILLDANLSHRLVARIQLAYPEVTHVKLVGLDMHTPDIVIWRWAKENGYALIVTNDEDFPSLLAQLGPPPKVVHLRLRNQVVQVYAEFLLAKVDVINSFLKDDSAELLEFDSLG